MVDETTSRKCKEQKPLCFINSDSIFVKRVLGNRNPRDAWVGVADESYTGRSKGIIPFYSIKIVDKLSIEAWFKTLQQYAEVSERLQAGREY